MQQRGRFCIGRPRPCEHAILNTPELRERVYAPPGHQALPVAHKTLVHLDAPSGADAHCQVNNPTRLAKDVCDWLDAFFAARP
jgi:hypothetical protein